MERREEQIRGPKSTGADGGDLLQSQAEMWMGLGEALAGILRRVRSLADRKPPEDVTDDRTEGEAGQGGSSGREAA